MGTLPHPTRAMLAPIRLGNATASLPLRGQPRRKEKHPRPAPHHSRPYALSSRSGLVGQQA